MDTLPPPNVSYARDAALIVTFYGPRQTEAGDHLSELLTALVTQLSLNPGTQAESWQNLDPDREVFLRRFDPPAAPDSSVLQLALNEPGAVVTAWQTLRQRLEQALEQNAPQKVWEGVWGYSLFYQAEIDAPPSGSAIINPEADLMPAVRGLFPAQTTLAPLHPITQCATSDGSIYLVGIPSGNRSASASIYMALAYPHTENRLVTRYIYGSQAELLMPDLIAHKGYHQARQFQLDEFHSLFTNHLANIQQDMHSLLHKMENARHRSWRLKKLAQETSYLSESLAHLERLRVSMSRQLHNYGWWLPGSQVDELLVYHRTFMENAQVELQLLVEEGQGALQAAGMAVDMVNTRLENEKGRQQEFLNTLLAVLAVGLAVPQILDREVIAAGLAATGLLPASDSQQVVWLFAAQAGGTLLLMLCAGVVVYLLMRLRSHRGDS